MLNLIRQHADSWMIKTILWMIILAFVGTIFYSWGMGGASVSRGGVVATVEGIKISYNEYDKAFNNLVNFYRNQFRNQFSEDMILRLDLKTQALDSLIQKKLLLLEADKLDIEVSDAELIDRIKNFPAFQKDNQFNPAYYQNYLKFQRVTPSEFEESQREGLIIEKMEKLITSNTRIPKSDALDTYKKEKETLKLDYIVFPEDNFRSPEPVTEGNLKDYYEKNKGKFEVPEQIKVDYIKVTPQQYEKDIEPRDDEIQDYYESKITDFRVEKKYQASHILFQLEPAKADEKATPEEKQKAAEKAAQAEAEEALKKIREGADFAAIAKKYSDDTASGSKGGSLGEFSRGTMVPAFEAALEKLKVGEVSEPVKTPFGYHIIRLDGVQKERIKSLDEVKSTIIQAIKINRARHKARRVVKRIYKTAETNGDLAQAAAANKIEVKTSDFFSRKKHDVPEIGMVPEFYNIAFSLRDNQVSDPIHTPEASFLLKIAGRKPAYIPELTEIRDQIREAYIESRDKEYTQTRFKELKEQLTGESGLEKIAKELHLDIQHTPFFSQADSIPGIGDIQDVKNKVFLLKKGESTAAKVFKKYYLMRVQDRQEAGEPSKDEIKTITARLRVEKATASFRNG